MNKDLENYINLQNYHCKEILSEIEKQMRANYPEKFHTEDVISFETALSELQKQINIDYINEIAKQYNIVFWDNCYNFLVTISSLDERGQEIKTKEQIEEEFYNSSIKRRDIIQMAEIFNSDNIVRVGVKNYKYVDTNDFNFKNTMAFNTLNIAFKAKKELYCHHLKIDETTQSIDTNKIKDLLGVEERYIKSYEKLTKRENEIALKFKILAQNLHSIEYLTDVICSNDWEFNPDIKNVFENKWANTKKSSFMVDLFVHFNIIPKYIKEKSGQDKMQYIKAKLKQADNVIKSLS